MQEVASLGSHFSVYLACLPLPTGSLSTGQFNGGFPHMAWIGDLLSGGKGHQIFQAEIDTNLIITRSQTVSHFTDQIKIPVPFGILAETTRPNILWDLAGQPKSIFLPKECNGITIDLEWTCALKWHPSEGPFWTEADPPTWAPFGFIATGGELLTDRLYRIAMQTEILTAPTGQFDQIKARRPAPVESAAIVLNATTVVPYLIDRYGHASEPFTRCRILDPISICQQHPANLIDLQELCKIFSVNLLSLPILKDGVSHGGSL